MGVFMSRVGMTSNHGMQSINVREEIAKQEKELLKNNKGWTVCCPFCATEFRFNNEEYEVKDVFDLQDYFRKNQCPYCQAETYRELIGQVIQHTFMILGNKLINCVKYPANYMFHSVPKSYEEQKQKYEQKIK